jgi:crotonobetainyl-CoA:carnitine CoA-transferase CaiB-like acyl-CoA transferase
VNGPLTGIRVLDFSRVLSGPHCTKMLSDLGADVIKVEPPDGDLTRYASPRINGLSAYFVQQNAGKRNISIDLSSPKGVEIAVALAATSDVLVENYRAGVMKRLGLGVEEMTGRFPRLIYASISGYGATGPWVERRAYASVVGAEAGITKLQGDARGGDYANDPLSHADSYTALELTTAILAALYQREHTGQGQSIDVSMAETMLFVNDHLNGELWDGPEDPAAIRNFGPGDYIVFELADGDHVIVSGHPAEKGTFGLFLRAFDVEAIADDPRFADVASRLANAAELRQVLLDAARRIPDWPAFEEGTHALGLAVGRIRSGRDLADTEWASERGAIAEVSDRGGGTIRIPNPPWHFGAAEVGLRGGAKYRGEDNRHVLTELLGYDDAAIDALEADGVLSSRVPSSAV